MDLLRSFVEKLVAQEQEVDWNAIWAASEGAPTVESAIGAVITTAYLAGNAFDEVKVDEPASDLIDTLKHPNEVPEWPSPGPLVLRTPAWRDYGVELVAAATPSLVHAGFISDSSTAPTTEVFVHRAEAATNPAYLQASERTATRLVLAPSLATVFTWVRNIGVIILLFVAWQLWGTAFAQHHSQGVLKTEFERSERVHQPSTGVPTALVPATAHLPQTPEGSVVGHLQIPAIGVDQYVVSGTATDDLSKGPGHYIGTAMPGQAGNVAIAGHRTTEGAPFNQLGRLSVGDKVELTALNGLNLTYVVSQAPVAVSPSDTSVLNDFGDNRVTLTTCNPEFSAAQRLIVVARLTKGVAVPTAKSSPVTYHIVNPATASWDLRLFPLVLLEILCLAALGLAFRRSIQWFGRLGCLLLLIPIWVAGLYLLFGSLTSFLPSSI